MSRKSPQEKKELEYTKGHFTFGFKSSRMFPKTWKRKKTQANRQYRRKSQELLAGLKPGMDEEGLISDDLTAARSGTLTLGHDPRLLLSTNFEAKNSSRLLDGHRFSVAATILKNLGVSCRLKILWIGHYCSFGISAMASDMKFVHCAETRSYGKSLQSGLRRPRKLLVPKHCIPKRTNLGFAGETADSLITP